jgi:hypothetical protein
MAQGLSCDAPQKLMLEIDLMFGRNIGGELGVSEGLWSDFMASEITPRFPEGLTVLDAMGQWQDKERNTIVKEPSKDVRADGFRRVSIVHEQVIQVAFITITIVGLSPIQMQ